jgi:hypothetical protein
MTDTAAPGLKLIRLFFFLRQEFFFNADLQVLMAISMPGHAARLVSSMLWQWPTA